MLRTIQYSFPSKADGLEISCLAVVPELERNEKYRGIIQIVHGMSEYKERYIPFMEYMAERKYISVIHDHRGHGKSVRSKEDLGYMYGGGGGCHAAGYPYGELLDQGSFPRYSADPFRTQHGLSGSSCLCSAS